MLIDSNRAQVRGPQQPSLAETGGFIAHKGDATAGTAQSEYVGQAVFQQTGQNVASAGQGFSPVILWGVYMLDHTDTTASVLVSPLFTNKYGADEYAKVAQEFFDDQLLPIVETDHDAELGDLFDENGGAIYFVQPHQSYN